MAIDLAPLWDFSQPELSEQRFRAALATAGPDDSLILQTQIARTYGLLHMREIGFVGDLPSPEDHALQEAHH